MLAVGRCFRARRQLELRSLGDAYEPKRCAAEIVKQVTAIGVKRIGVFYRDDSYGKAGLEGVTRALTPLGLALTGLGTVARNTVDVDAAVNSILAQKHNGSKSVDMTILTEDGRVRRCRLNPGVMRTWRGGAKLGLSRSGQPASPDNRGCARHRARSQPGVATCA